MFLESYPFLLGCQICWHIIVHSILLWFFVFLRYPLRCLLFHFLFCLFGFSLFSSWWAWPGVCQSCLPFQRTSSWFCWFFLSFFNLYFIYFLPDLYYFFPNSVLEGCFFPDIFPFLWGYTICWHIMVDSILLWLFVFLW